MTNARGWLVVALVAAAWLAAGLSRAPAQSLDIGRSHHHHPAADAQLHEQFYSTWKRPDMPGLGCCSLQDCYPTPIRQAANGTYEGRRREDGKWITIPPAKMDWSRGSPDGGSHMCAPPPWFDEVTGDPVDDVFCAIVGGAV
jgi:hypothetical protein